VQWPAQEAVKDARQQDNVELDYSVDSIQQVEKVWSGMHEKYVKETVPC